MTVIHGEIASGGDQLVLVAGGLDMDGVAEAARRLKALTPLFSKSKPPGALTAPLTWACVVQLAATFGDAWRPGPRLTGWIADQARLRTAPADGPLTYAPPAGLVPRPYQVDGAALIARTGRTLIFDEPRTGKSVVAALGLAERSLRCAPVVPIVVIAPASVVDPWVEIFTDWAPHWRTVAWRGPKREALAGTADVYVTSYETARLDAGPVTSNGKRSLRPLFDLKPCAVVIDEFHMCKNHRALRTQAVLRLTGAAVGRGGAVVALSGTPITHHPGDLWSALSAIEPGAFPSRDRYVNRYCDVVPGDYDDDILGLNAAREPEFRLSILGQHRRVARADVMAQLPEKVYSVRTVELPATWRRAYDDLESQMLAELPTDEDGNGGGELSVMDRLSVLTHLSALASAAADVQITYGPDLNKITGEPKRHVHLDLKAPSWKVDALLEILEERCTPRATGPAATQATDPVVCFAPSKQLIDLAGQAAAKAGYRVGYVVGGQSQGERTRNRKAFQAGELDLLCVTTGAGGTGLTLSRAGTLVFLQRPWSLVESLQAEDRAEGDLAATRGTEVIDVVAKNAIDSRVRAVLRERGGQLADLVADPRIVQQLLGGLRVPTANPREETAA
ncbi:MAG: DEAD/DEAH box helicase [Nocardioides sp.]|uniref:SNF2-related protein n=1 Tax=Nocardioides sp. TaxID=35761 RepID=UPI0039E60B18